MASVMLAYLLHCILARVWAELDLTVEEGLIQLASLCAIELHFPGRAACFTVPQPRSSVAALYAVADVASPPRFLENTSR